MSAQRFEQNGLNAGSTPLPQIAQRAGESLRSSSFMACRPSLNPSQGAPYREASPVIPGRHETAGPESILRSVEDYGFRARGQTPAPRNDSIERLHRVEPAEADRAALAPAQGHGLIERQADDVRVGTDQLDDEGAGDALRCIAAGLAAPFAGGEVGLDILLRQPLEAHAGFHQALAG